MYAEAFDTREEAMRREVRIKRMSRAEKLELIRQESGETHE